MNPLSLRRRLVYGVGFAAILWLGIEGLSRLIWGPPPPSDMVVRMSQCALVIGAEQSMLDCKPGEHADLRFPTQPEADIPRVVFLGGSSVRETHIQSAVTNFPMEVAKLLPSVEVLNLGVPGMGAANVAVLASQLEAISPDLVVMYTGHNDYSSDVFHGAIRATRLWMLPVYRLLASSWVHGALARRARGTPRHERPQGLVIPTSDTLAGDVRDAVDARFEADLRLAVELSPAPVFLCTLLRNPAVPPTGVLTKDQPECADQLNKLVQLQLDARAQSAAARTACGESSITAWWQSVAHRSAQQTPEAIEAWYRSLDTDAIPLRAPPSADRIIRTIANETGATLVDLEQALGPLPPSRLFVDTLHLSPQGAAAVAEVLAAEIDKALSTR
jgi:hypothetical protein